MTYPGHRRDTVTRILPQETPVVGNPLWRPIPAPEICPQAAQHEREAHRELAVPYVSREVYKTPVITPWCTSKRKFIRCASDAHSGQNGTYDEQPA
jgi:hypothetical protein